MKVKGSWWRHWTLRKAIGVLLAMVGVVVVLGAAAVVMTYEKTPIPTSALEATGFSQSVVYSKDGKLIGRFGSTNRKLVTWSELQNSPIVDAALAAEDRNFYNEGGISPTGIMRAAYEDVTGGDGSTQGGSTITQQFVRQYYSGIGTQQTASRKIKEIFVAMKVAKEKSKPWILTNYLNTIYFGDGAYGVQAAAQTYYGKSVEKLTVAQAAVIAAIIQQPSNYPLPQYRPQLETRWHYVLTGMVQMGKLTQQQADTMKFPAPNPRVPRTLGKDVWDPYVLNMVEGELGDVYGLTKSQIYNGGYVIRTSIDDTKMETLYKAVADNVAQIDESSVPFNPVTMHAGAVLEDPATGAIQALYPGPGYAGYRYNGTGKVISAKYCEKIHCQLNMALTREQVGSSFKPYILAQAVKDGMNVKTSTLNGYNYLHIAPDSSPMVYSSAALPADSAGWSLPVGNDSTGENGPYTPQVAMGASINTAYADLWHRVAGTGGQDVLNMAKSFGVDIVHSGLKDMANEYGIALGQASLSVTEQATMLATIANGGIYHSAHVITSITRPASPPIPIKVNTYPVFSSSPSMNQNMATQMQYAMSQVDNPSYGTAPNAAMSNGQEIVGKTGTTNKAQSAFFIGAIPSQALAVAFFTDNQSDKTTQTLDGLGGIAGGFGGTWPANIWHTYAENEFALHAVQEFPTPVFTGTPWNQVPPNLRKVAKKHKKPNHNHNGDGNGNGNGGQGGGNGGGNPNPWPTYSCDPTVVTCTPAGDGGGGNQNGANNPNPDPATTPVGAIVIGLPLTGLWVRHRQRRRPRAKGPRSRLDSAFPPSPPQAR